MARNCLIFGEEVLDQMARGIKLLVIVARRGPVGSRRDHRGLARGGQWRKDASIGVERLVGDQRIGLHRGQQVVRPLQVVCLAAGQEEVDDVDGALWARKLLDECRVRRGAEPERLRRVVVAIDPPGASGKASAECGIVIATRCRRDWKLVS